MQFLLGISHPVSESRFRDALRQIMQESAASIGTFVRADPDLKPV